MLAKPSVDTKTMLAKAMPQQHHPNLDSQIQCLLRQCQKFFCILILRIVRIGFEKQYNQINNYAYSAKSRSTNVQYSEKDASLVEFMRSEQSEKQA